jgi:hypothetical protein
MRGKGRHRRKTQAMATAVLGVVALVSIALTAHAVPFTVTGSSGNRAASATFDTSGTNLIVTLTNTSTEDVLVPVDVLTAVFFTLAGNPTLTSVSAVLKTGSSVLFDPAPAGGVVGGEWGYVDGLAGAPGGADEGISSSGYDLFSSATFPGPNLDGPEALNGLQYGITSAGDNPTTGNAQVTDGGFPLIKNSVVFTLSGLLSGFDPSALNAITNVSFQYGTSLTEPNVPGGGLGGAPVPEPSSVLLLGSGLIGLLWWGKKRWQARS